LSCSPLDILRILPACKGQTSQLGCRPRPSAQLAISSLFLILSLFKLFFFSTKAPSTIDRRINSHFRLHRIHPSLLLLFSFLFLLLSPLLKMDSTSSKTCDHHSFLKIPFPTFREPPPSSLPRIPHDLSQHPRRLFSTTTEPIPSRPENRSLPT